MVRTIARKILKIVSLPITFLSKYLQIPIFSLPLLKKVPFEKQRKILNLAIVLIPSIVLLIYLFWDLPLPNQLTSDVRNPVSTQILDRNGKLIYEIFAEKRRSPVNLSSLPPYVKQATIAIEDKDFYQHHGFSVTGIARAFYKDLFKQDLQGGSTITQQLIKTTLLTSHRTLRRKIREFMLAVIVDIVYPKDKILEMYLNNVPYGGTAWGIESASETYFGKPAKDLDLAQSALLAGLPQAPTYYSPFGAHPELAQERQKQVLKRMREDGYITKEQERDAGAEELKFIEQKGIKAPHFALYVKDQLVQKYGESTVERGGLRVTTTLDLDLQEFAQKTVAEEVDKLKKANVGNGAALVTNPQTGEIYAMVGSKDYFAQDEDGKVNVTIRPRQPGSSIKPLNYALAIMDKKITPATVLADIPTCFTVLNQPLYCPVNYDGLFHGAVQARFALGNSFNIPAVRVLTLNGVKNFVDFVQKMGLTTITDPSQYGLSLTLGGGEVKMLDMATAFGVFADGGVREQLVSILKVQDWKGNVLEETKIQDGKRIIPMDVAYIISHILLDNGARSAAFGDNSLLNVSGFPQVSVKTGTTNDKRDNWTIGYTPEVVATVWVGNNDNSPMSAVASGITGATPIWNKIIKQALTEIEGGTLGNWGQTPEKHKAFWPAKPDGVVGKIVCATTGTLPPGPEDNPGCPTRFEYFLQDNFPPPAQDLAKPVNVYKDTQMLASQDAPADQTQVATHQIITDPLGTPVCLDCPLQNWSVVVNPANIPTQNTGKDETSQ